MARAVGAKRPRVGKPTSSRLLSLPPEIFEQIIETLVKDGGLGSAIKLRLTCWTFERYLMPLFIKMASRCEVTLLFTSREYKRLFRFHGSAILEIKASSTDSTSPYNFARLVQHMIDSFPQSDFLNAVQREEQRSRYTTKICEAMQALEPRQLRWILEEKDPSMLQICIKDTRMLRPALAAAFGEPFTLGQTINLCSYGMEYGATLFPNPLNAAVATEQKDALEFILDFLSYTVSRGSYQKGSRREMRSAACSVGSALRVAIKLHKDDATATIFDFLTRNNDLRQSMPSTTERELITTCILNDNVESIIPALKFVRGMNPTDSSIAQCLLSGDDIRVLLKHGRMKMLQHLIDKGQVNPRNFTPFQIEKEHRESVLRAETPLQRALVCKRFDLAQLLLHNGAYVDGLQPSSQQTCLHLAVATGSTDQIKFLLRNGAQPGRSDDPSSPWGTAFQSKSNIGLFLIRAFMEHGIGYLERADLLQKFADGEKQIADWERRSKWPQ